MDTNTLNRIKQYFIDNPIKEISEYDEYIKNEQNISSDSIERIRSRLNKFIEIKTNIIDFQIYSFYISAINFYNKANLLAEAIEANRGGFFKDEYIKSMHLFTCMYDLRMSLECAMKCDYCISKKYSFEDPYVTSRKIKTHDLKKLRENANIFANLSNIKNNTITKYDTNQLLKYNYQDTNQNEYINAREEMSRLAQMFNLEVSYRYYIDFYLDCFFPLSPNYIIKNVFKNLCYTDVFFFGGILKEYINNLNLEMKKLQCSDVLNIMKNSKNNSQSINQIKFYKYLEIFRKIKEENSKHDKFDKELLNEILK